MILGHLLGKVAILSIPIVTEGHKKTGTFDTTGRYYEKTKKIDSILELFK